MVVDIMEKSHTFPPSPVMLLYLMENCVDMEEEQKHFSYTPLDDLINELRERHLQPDSEPFLSCAKILWDANIRVGKQENEDFIQNTI